MQFLDEAKIFVKSGNGGQGCVSFRRERFIAKGGPNGGNGGKGGDIVIKCDPAVNTLIDFRYKKHFKAKNGQSGSGSDKTGAGGADVIVKVPRGTQIFTEEGDLLIADITNADDELIIAKGGCGGIGNASFKSSVNRTPRQFTKGEAGEERLIYLKLKLFSDIGIVGLPNAGKSTLLSKVSRARPKIADYPFTTLIPKLGVVYIDNSEFVMADIPGLIKEAHLGKGLGDKFLKHIERCFMTLHLIDISSEDPVENYQIINNEIRSYSDKLTNKPQIIAVNKIDLIDKKDLQQKIVKLKKVSGAKKIFSLSSISGEGIEPLLRFINSELIRYKTDNV